MKRRYSLFLALVLSAPVAAFAGKAEADLQALSAKMLNGFATADTTTFKAVLSDRIWGAWDLDMLGHPAAMKNSDEALKLMDDFAAAMKSMGATLSIRIEKNECHVTGALGVCMVEASQTLTVPNQSPMNATFRNTEVYEKGKGGWKLVHHHGSIAKAPELPPKFMAYHAKSSEYVPVPSMPGVSMIPMFTNPVTMASVGLMKAGPDGLKEARHVHQAAYWAYIVDGGMTTTDANGKDADFGPGTVVYRPANEPHLTKVKPNTVFFMVTDGPVQHSVADSKGSAMPATPAFTSEKS